MTSVTWTKCKDDVWCNLIRVNLEPVATSGVYIIWHGGDDPQVVRVGQGNIADRLGDHRNDLDILDYSSRGGLFVTWAVVPAGQRDGVERFLADQLSPLVGEVFPDAEPVAVNLPW